MSVVAALPNVLAMAVSLAAVSSLSLLARRLGGELGTMLRLLLVGVFLSVFAHAGVELAETAGVIGEHALMIIMATLLTTGSLAFCAAAWVGLRALR